jgi:hypothetical protein
VISLLRGQQPAVNEGKPALRAIVLGIMGIVALQIIGMVWSLATLRSWFRDSQPDVRPRGWRRVGWHVVVPLVANLFLGFAVMVGFPAVFGTSLQGFMFVYPDLGYTMAMSVSLLRLDHPHCSLVVAAIKYMATNIAPWTSMARRNNQKSLIRPPGR